MAYARVRPSSVSTSSSLMQSVPGSFPPAARASTDSDEFELEEPVYQSLAQAVYARRAEYVQHRSVRVKVGTWNVGAFKGAEKDVGGWFVDGKGISERLSGLSLEEQAGEDEREDVGAQEQRYARKKSTIPKNDIEVLPGHEDVGLYVLCLQEVVDITSPAEALRPYNDPSVAQKWKDAMNEALPPGYRLVAEQQLIGLLLLVFASEDVAKDVKAVSTTSVGTGLMGYMGNKGAVTARIVLGETTRIVFVNCHLAAGADKAALERRNWDAQQIVNRTKFEPIQDAMELAQNTGEQLGEEDFAFWAGDLNYRLEGIPGDDVRRLLMLHTRNEYDLSQRSARKIEEEIESATESVHRRMASTDSTDSSVPFSPSSSQFTRASTESTSPSTLVDEISASEDPTSLQTTLSSLLPHDELHQQMKTRKAFHDGWREGPITFLPTYKYDPGSVGVYDSSEKKRAPSWCDRILYRTGRDKTTFEEKVREEEAAHKKDEEMKANGTEEAAKDEELLYEYDPETDGATSGNDDYDEYDEENDGTVTTKEGFHDEIELEYYTAHQRVLSSDHKPLDAIFMLKYDAVIPELKAKIHADVVRELDKAENDYRPNVVVVVDKHNNVKEASNDCPVEKFEGVWFGDVRWSQTKHRTLTIANTGRVPATFTFIERPVAEGQNPGIAPRWLSLKIDSQMVASSLAASAQVKLDPGSACVVDMELRITQTEDIEDLNAGKHAIDDILVLRVEHGRDHFIPLRGNWLETSLGRSIDKLTRIPEGGIRKLQRQKPEGGQGRPSSTSDATRQAPDETAQDPTVEREPVRFSAPRELFRLTEAIEVLCARVIAEWEMTNPTGPTHDHADDPDPPWDKHPGWPFDQDCWSERHTSQWNTALSDACNALDCDEPLDAAMPAELPRMQRLYVLCDLLFLFLNTMSDGVVDAEMWSKMEQYLADVEQAKKKPSLDDQRTSIQELMANFPGHSISFMLITSLLERTMQDLAATEKSKNDASTGAAKAAGIALKRMSIFGKPPTSSHTDLVMASFAKIFAQPLIHSASPSSDKIKAVQERRKAEMIEMFLKASQPA